MKNLKLPLLFLICLLAASTLTSCKNRQKDKDKQNEKPQVNAVPAEVAKKYREDAARLALREYNTTSRNQDPQITIPKERTEYFFKLLTKVYGMMQTDPAIPDVSHIHTFDTPPLYRIIAMLENDAPFKDEWLEGRRMTSNLYLNQVMSEAGLKITGCKELGTGCMCTLSSPKPVNTKDLSFILSRIDGIKYAEPDGAGGDGNDIVWGSEGKNHMALKYKVGKGDCPSGCIHNKYWIFYVQEDGSVNYMGTRGELPEGEEE